MLREGSLIVEGRLEASQEEMAANTNVYRSIFIEKIWSVDAVTGNRQAINTGATGFPGEMPRFATKQHAEAG